MAKYQDSDFARNKKAESIVYLTATGERIEITLEAYLKENPNMTEKDFYQLKKHSDKIYYDETLVDRDERRAVKNCQVLCESKTDTTEEFLIQQNERNQILDYVKSLISDSNLTEPQKRRYLKYYGKGMKLREIAQEECVTHKAVYDSLRWANKKIEKIKKIFKND